MHTITGIGRLIKLFTVYAGYVLLVATCRHPEKTTDENITVRAKVKVTKVFYKDLDEKVALTATTVYLGKSEISAPASGYIATLDVRPGDFVKKGHKLFSLETKEHRAIHQDSAINKMPVSDLGLLSLFAPADGFVNNLIHAPGDYVQEGAAICAFVHSDKLLFQAYIPFTYNKIIKPGNHCTLLLPDSTVVQAFFGNPLNTVEASSQTCQVLIIPERTIFLPDGLNATLFITTGYVNNAQVLPVSALLSDETLQHYWLMKIINDSIAVKIPVKPGLRQGNWIEIKAPVLNDKDNFITAGNYGLSDTALVEIVK